MIEMSKSKLADLLGVTPRTLTTWATEPDFPRPERRGRANAYDAGAVVQWWRTREIARLIDSEDGELLDLNQERAKLARAQASRQQLILAHERGDAVLVADVAASVGAVLTTVRAHLLSLPSKCAPAVHVAETLPETQAILDKAVHEALSELSENELCPPPPA